MSTSTHGNHGNTSKMHGGLTPETSTTEDHGIFDDLDHEHFDRSWVPTGPNEDGTLVAGRQLTFSNIPTVDGADAQAVLLYIYDASLENGMLGDNESPFVVGLASVVGTGATVIATISTTFDKVHAISLPSLDTWGAWVKKHPLFPQWLGPTVGSDDLKRLEKSLKTGTMRVILYGKTGPANDRNG